MVELISEGTWLDRNADPAHRRALFPHERSGSERACKPNPVPNKVFRGPFGLPNPRPGSRSFLWARGRPRAQAADPEMSRTRRGGTGALHLPIWPCSAWGLPCPLRCRRGGALLPHRFTLAVRPSRGTGRRSLLCGTFLRVAATGHYPACCPFGVRTFLPGCPGRSRGPLGAVRILA